MEHWRQNPSFDRTLSEVPMECRVIKEPSFFWILLGYSCLLTNCSVGSFEPTFTETEQGLFQIDSTQMHRFGYLEVLEDRSKPNGKTIKLPVYIFKCRNPSEHQDPIIYTVGGPGYSTMRTAKYMQYYRYLDDRDFILFEQRGTQYAQPHLDCPEWADAMYHINLMDLENHEQDSILTQAATACRQHLTGLDIDLDQYHTEAIAADFVDLRKALQLESYNLLTMSYSTKIAQVLLRDHPEGIRSVVMDSPLPLEVNYDEESLSNLMHTLKQLLDDCAADPACNRAFPKLKQRFLDFLADKTSNPQELTLKHPASQTDQHFRLRGIDFITLFSQASTDEIASIPNEIEKILQGDLSTIEDQLSGLFSGPGKGNGIGMRLSVWCAEEYPFVSQATVQAAAQQYPQLSGVSPAVFSAAVCDAWKVAPAPPLENMPITSEVPVLLISGSYDSNTPVQWARDMQKNLPNSFHLIFPGWTHTPTTNWSNPCAMEAANDFFNTPTNKPAPACLKSITASVFNSDR